jgi:DNA-binding PadR family transcriptional regulator
MVGASPSFSEVHVLRVLFLLKDKKYLGRKKLVRSLGIGEGSIRTILKKLKNKGFISSTKQGHSLTKKGAKRLSYLLKKFSKPKKINSKIVEGKKTAIVVHNATKKIGKGLEERDIAVKAGANGALLLKYHNKIHSTVSEFKLSDFPDLLSEIKKFNLQNGDVIVISFGDTVASAENGALAIALNLIRKIKI